MGQEVRAPSVGRKAGVGTGQQERTVVDERPEQDPACVQTTPETISLHLRLPARPADLPRQAFIRDSLPISTVNPQANAAAMREVGINPEIFTDRVTVTDTYARHWKSFVQMAYGIFPQTSETLFETTNAVTEGHRDAESTGTHQQKTPQHDLRTNRQMEQLQQQFTAYLDAWYSSNESSVRTQLLTQLQERQPEFTLQFGSEHDLTSAAKILGGEITAYQVSRSLPQNIEELFTNFMGLGGFVSKGDDSYQHLISIGAVTADQVAASGNQELQSILEQLPELSKQSSLGQTLIHEEIHARTGYPHPNQGSFDFQTAEHAMEIPSVLFELITITDAYHHWMQARDSSYDYRANPTGILLKTPQAELSVDFIYREARERFGLLDQDGLDRFLSLLDKPETIAFLNRSIWGSGRPPEILPDLTKPRDR